MAISQEDPNLHISVLSGLQPTFGWNNKDGDGGGGQRGQTTIEGESLMLYTSAPTEVTL